MHEYRDRAAKDIDHFLSSLLNCLNCREKYANCAEKAIKGAARLILLILRRLFSASIYLLFFYLQGGEIKDHLSTVLLP